MKIRRAMLYMPGDDRHKIEKGTTLGVDSIIMDLEDAVALARKNAARETVLAALREVNFGRTERVVRVHARSSGMCFDDIDATVAGRPDAYLIAKVESETHVRDVSARLTLAEREHGWAEESIRVLAMIETALGVLHLREIVASDPRLDGLVFGAEDFASSIGATRTPEGLEVAYARSALVLHAKAYGLQAIDMVYTDLNNLDGLSAEALRALHLGFDGKTVIHPRQVAPVQDVFTPDPEEIDHAKRLIDAYHAHQAAGKGAFELDGKMIDLPMLRAAEIVLARAHAAGISTD